MNVSKVMKNCSDLTSAILTSKRHSNHCINNLINEFPQSGGIIGVSKSQIPYEWLIDINKDKKACVSNIILNAFAQIQEKLQKSEKVIKNIHSRRGDSIIDFANKDTISESSAILEKTLKRAGVLKRDNEAKLSTAGRGAFGAVYRFAVNGESYVLKSFLPYKKMIDGQIITNAGKARESLGTRFLNKIIRNQFSRKMKYHGVIAEATKGLFWHSNAPNSQFDVMLFADLNKGYIVSRDVTKLPKPQRLISPSDYGIWEKDNMYGDNTSANFYVYDFGGQIVKNKVLAFNKAAREVFLEIKNTSNENRAKKFVKLYKQKTNIKKDINAGLKMALILLSKDDLKKLPVKIKLDLFLSSVKLNGPRGLFLKYKDYSNKQTLIDKFYDLVMR